MLLNLIYMILVLAVSPALLYQRMRYGKYRDGWDQKLWGNLPERRQSDSQRIWIHAVSVGEVLQLTQIIQGLHQQYPTAKILVTTTTQTGYQVAREKLTDCQVAYFPLDFTWSVSNAFQRVAPDLVVLVELELWPNFLKRAEQMEIPVVVINGRLSEKSYRGYRKIRWIFSRVLRRVRQIAAQSEEYRQRFVSLGYPLERIEVTGSIKFDGIETCRERPAAQELREFFQLKQNEIVFIAGSTQSPEEEMALQAYSRVVQQVPQLRLILVPRHPERGGAIAQQIESAGFNCVRRSTGQSTGNGHISVGLLDTVGELKDCWALAEIAFVGGSFGNRGGQNMLEPAAYGAAVCFGPNTRNFRQIVELLQLHSAATMLPDQSALDEFVLMMAQDNNAAVKLGQKAQKLVLSQQGATEKTVAIISRLLNDSSETSPAFQKAA